MLAWWTVSTALAAPCADVPAQVAVAWDAYEEAELERAKSLLAEAYAGLACQRAVVPPEALLALYRLDALVSLTQEDRKSSVYATIRAVTVDPEHADPPPEYGPELAELYALWSARLGETFVTVSVADGGSAWVDGHLVDHTTPRRVVQGEHLIQIQGPLGVTSEVREVAVDTALTTGVALPLGVVLTQTPGPAHDPRRKHPAAWLVTGGLAGALGGAALATAWRSEQVFLDNPYQADAYAGCARGEDCWAANRRTTIDRDAWRIRAAYVGGYGFTGIGVALLGVGIVGVPVRTDGRSFHLDLRW